jgi:outer membrane lipoprotein-sorting protein
MIIAPPASAENISSLVEKAKAMQAQFEKQVKDLTIVGEMTMKSPQGEMTTQTKTMKKGSKFRMESKVEISGVSNMPQGMGQMETTVIFDGVDTWVISSFMGKRKVSGEEAKDYQIERQWWDMLSKGASITGSETVGGRECWVVEMKKIEDAAFGRMWLDKDQLVLVKGESRSPEGETTQWVQSDFRKVAGGREMAHRTEIYSNGKLVSVSRVTSIDVNRGLSDSLFDAAGIKAEGGEGLQELMKQLDLE